MNIIKPVNEFDQMDGLNEICMSTTMISDV